MKKNNYIKLSLTVLFFSISSLMLNAQVSDENTFIINKYFQNVSSIESTVKQTLNTNSQKTDYAGAAELNILQSGNYNFISINQSNNMSVSQLGNNNSYNFSTYYGRNDLNIDVQQIGKNNAINIFGENSLINNMKIIQKSNNQSITINNYQ